MKNNRLWNVSEGGDILRNDLHSDTKKKYKPDLALDKSFIPSQSSIGLYSPLNLFKYG